MKTILTLDLGTSSVRGTLYSIDGEELFSAAHSYAPEFLNDGRVRQAPSSWNDGVLEVLRRCGDASGETDASPQVIAVTSQRASVIPVDESGTALYDAIMWQDKTTHAECREIERQISNKEAYSITGLRIDPYFSAPKIMWLKGNEPDIFKRSKAFLGVQDYVVLMLTGKMVTDHSQACRTLLMDIRSREWSPRMLEICAVDESRLPALVAPGSIVAPLLPKIAEATHLPSHTRVLLAGGDQQVAAIGMGVITEGTAEANTGTGSFLIAPVAEPVLHPEEKTLCSAAAIPGQWVAEAGVLTTGILYSWFAAEFTSTFTSDSEDFAEINKLVKESPPGANGIIALPHFKGSAAPFWNPYAKGLFFNLTLANTRADMARALLESVVLDMGANLKLLQELLPRPIAEVVIAGGLTRFDLFNQLQADVFATQVRRPANSEASSTGALISALVTLGVHADYRTAFEAVGGPAGTRLQPSREHASVYEKADILREKLYRALDEAGIYRAAHEYSESLGESIGES